MENTPSHRNHSLVQKCIFATGNSLKKIYPYISSTFEFLIPCALGVVDIGYFQAPVLSFLYTGISITYQVKYGKSIRDFYTPFLSFCIFSSIISATSEEKLKGAPRLEWKNTQKVYLF